MKTIFLISNSLDLYYAGTDFSGSMWVKSQEAAIEYSTYESAERRIMGFEKGYYQIQKVFIVL